ncbi:MAG: hypothetical protein MK175_20100 [Pseudoalteromonas sp.]|uniref:DUF4116 domain-containing protein n=1 Tax=Pseudoalteromonas sp. TaxID=53249 RepID=UPI0025F867BE|nr:DUF4116 domain-containing protein [Pseudoalteromonas sp.]MCH2089491.1 hypothetical protein [Pseudoalteromonas sp.]
MIDSRQDIINRLKLGDISLNQVDKKIKNYKVCLVAVNLDGLSLYHVPKRYKDTVMCKAAVYKNVAAIKFVPSHIIKNSDILSVCVNRQAGIFPWLVKMHRELIDYQVCFKAVNASGMNIRFCPSELIDEKMVKIAIERDGRSFDFIPKKFKSRDLVKHISIKRLPEQLMTYEHCLSEVKTQGRLLKYVRFDLIDEDMVNAALANNEWALEFVPITFNYLASYDQAYKTLEKENQLPDFLTELVI